MPRKYVILAKEAPGYIPMHRTNVQLPESLYRSVMDALVARRHAAMAAKSLLRPAMSFNGWVNEMAASLVNSWQKK